MGKQLELFPELDLNSKEPIQYDHGSGQFINKFSEKKKVMLRQKKNGQYIEQPLNLQIKQLKLNSLLRA